MAAPGQLCWWWELEAHREPTQRPKNLPGLRWVRTGPGPWWASSLPHPLPTKPSGWKEGSVSLPGERRRLVRLPPPQAAGGQRAGAPGTFPGSLRSSADTCHPADLATKHSWGLRAPHPVPARPGVRRAERSGQQRASIQLWPGLDTAALAAGRGVIQPSPRFSRRAWRGAGPLSPHPHPPGLGLGRVQVSLHSTQDWDRQTHWAVH